MAKFMKTQSMISFSQGKLLATRRPTPSPEKSLKKSPTKSPQKSPRKKIQKSPRKMTPKNQLPTPMTSSSRQVTLVSRTPVRDMPSSCNVTPLPQDTRETSSSGSSSDAEYKTPPEAPLEIPVVKHESSFMSKLNLSVQDKFEGPSFDLEQSSEIRNDKGKARETIVISSDDEPCGGHGDSTLLPSSPWVEVISSTETSPVPIFKSRLRVFTRKIVDSMSPEGRKKRPVEDGDTGSPKRRSVKREATINQEVAVEKEDTTETKTIKKANRSTTPNTSTPVKAALVRKAPRTATPLKRATPMKTPPQVIPETPFDSPASESTNDRFEQWISSTPAPADSLLSPAQDLCSDGVFSSPLKARRSQHTTTTTSMSLSPAQDLASEGVLTSPISRKPLRTCINKSSPDSVMSLDLDDDLFDDDNHLGSTSYFEGNDQPSESDEELRVSYNAADVKQRAEDRLAEILKEVRETTSTASTTPRGTSNEPEDDVVAKYHAAKLKEAERIQQHEEKKRAYYEKLREKEEARWIQQLMDAPLVDCETAAVELFTNDNHKMRFRPRHKVLEEMEEYSLKPTQVLPAHALDLKFNSCDVQWLLVKLAKETTAIERQYIVEHLKLAFARLKLADEQLKQTHIEEVMKAVGLRYWEKRKGSLENKVSAYSVLNKSRRTESMPCTPVKPKPAGRTESHHLITPVKAPRMDSPFSPFCSFESPSFSFESPFKAAKTPQPPPPFRYRTAESLADFFLMVAMAIKPDCTEFLFRLLLLVSSDSSLDSLQSDVSPTHGAMAFLLANGDLTVDRALELACDTVDLKSAQSRLLNVLYCGSDGTMRKLALSCSSVFFLQEYIHEKTASELATLYSTDPSILATTLMDNLDDFSHRSEKCSSFIRHMFGFFAQTIEPASTKSWTPEQLRDMESSLRSRSDRVANLDDFKFNALVMSWCSRVATEFIVRATI